VQATAVARFETSGAVQAADQVVLRSEMAGRVDEVLVEDGAALERGDPILRFEQDAEQAAVEAAQAAASEASADLVRAETLYERDVAAQSRVETAQAALDAARAELRTARARLDELTVRAPFAGEIGIVAPDPGSFLAPGDRIASFARTDTLIVRFDLPIEIARAAADAGRVRVVTEDGATLQARVVTVSPITDAGSRTRRFEAALPAGSNLSPGAFVTVSVPTASREGALFVPQTAILREGFDTRVYRAVEGERGLTARSTQVTTGVLDGEGRIEIRAGLSAVDRVVSSGLQKIRDGAAIRGVTEDGERQEADE